MTQIAHMQDAPLDAPIIVAALYKFTALDDLPARQARLKLICRKAKVKGTLLLAHEGINGTIAGTKSGIDAVLDALQSQREFADMELKLSHAKTQPFHRLKVRLKKEIVTLNQPDLDPRNVVGTYVAPENWNALITQPDVIVIDTRNDYEIAIGTFIGALNPHTNSFREFTDFVEEVLKPMLADGAQKKIAMFCTGGIRCEKSTSYLLAQGFAQVYHLKGGILRYLEIVPEEDSLWQGECFVFDNRVSVGHGLKLGSYDMCHACRMPVAQDEKNHPHFQQGISCAKCYGTHSTQQMKRFTERQKQMELANARGLCHIGDSAPMQ